MGINSYGVLGFSNHKRRSQNRFHRNTGIRTDQGDTSSERVKFEIHPDGRGGKTYLQECSHSNFSTIQPGFLVDFFPGDQKERRVASDHQPKTSEHLHQTRKVQDGELTDDPEGTHQGKLGGVNRPKGRISPRPNTSLRPEVASVYDRQTGIHFQMPSIRPIYRPKSLHKGGAGGRGLPAQTRNKDLHVPRRLADHRRYRGGDISRSRDSTEGNHSARLHNKSREVMSHTFSVSGIPRSPTRPCLRPSIPDTGENSELSVTRTVLPVEKDSTRIRLASDSGIHGEHGGPGTFLQIPHEDDSDVFRKELRSSYAAPVTNPLHHSRGTCRDRMVDLQHEPGDRNSLPTSIPSDDFNNRRIDDGLGRVYSTHSSPRDVVLSGSISSHQHVGIVGRETFSKRPRNLSYGEESPCQIRQHNSGSLYKQTGGDEVRTSMQGDLIPSPVVSEERNPPVSHSHPRDRQCASGQLVEGSVVKRQRLVSRESCLPRSPIAQELPYSGPLRDKPQQAATEVLLQVPRSSGLGSGCSLNLMEGSESLRLPSYSIDRQNSTKDTGGRLRDPPGSPVLAEASVVPDTPKNISSKSDTSTTEPGHPQDAGIAEGEISCNRQPQSDCMVLIKQRFQKEGLSEESANLATRGRRDSTLRIYSSRARPFIRWCTIQKIDPTTANVGEVADFLRSKFDLGLQSTTIKGYLSAIQSFHTGCRDGGSIIRSKTLKFLIEGMEITRPKTRNIWPSWDLPSVLNYLNHIPFEPLQAAPLRFIAIKTLFLIAIASGKRCSELHSLGVGKFTVFSKAGVTMYFRPGFLAKNERSDFSASPLFIPYLRRTDKRVQRLSCPVRALRWYLEKTSNIRGNETRLFISSKKPYKAVARSTLSGWLVNAIQSANAMENIEKPRGHSVRAYSATWAYAKGISINEILNTVSWKSDSTFTSTYLRDIRLRTARGRYASAVLDGDTNTN